MIDQASRCNSESTVRQQKRSSTAEVFCRELLFIPSNVRIEFVADFLLDPVVFDFSFSSAVSEMSTPELSSLPRNSCTQIATATDRLKLSVKPRIGM